MTNAKQDQKLERTRDIFASVHNSNGEVSLLQKGRIGVDFFHLETDVTNVQVLNFR